MRGLALVAVAACSSPKQAPEEPKPVAGTIDAAIESTATKTLEPTPPATPACTTKRKWAVFDLDADANLEPAARVFSDAFRAKAAANSCIELKLTAATHADARTSAHCESEAPQCMSMIGQDLGVDVLVWGKIERIGRKGMRLFVKHLDVAKQQLVAMWTRDLESTAHIGDAGAEAFTKLAP